MARVLPVTLVYTAGILEVFVSVVFISKHFTTAVALVACIVYTGRKAMAEHKNIYIYTLNVSYKIHTIFVQLQRVQFIYRFIEINKS